MLTIEKMAVLAPIPSASDRMATAETIGVARKARNASRRSDMAYWTSAFAEGCERRGGGALGSDPNHLLTVSLPLTGMPQTVPRYWMTTFPVGSFVAVRLVSVNGQFTPPCETSPLAVHLAWMTEIDPSRRR